MCHCTCAESDVCPLFPSLARARVFYVHAGAIEAMFAGDGLPESSTDLVEVSVGGREVEGSIVAANLVTLFDLSVSCRVE